jgi:flavin reductase (DIM6/NTAB) family NADH-FMN oxidoreductase RutF
MMSLRKLLFDNTEIPFVSSSLLPEEIKEKVYLRKPFTKELFEITRQHWIVCQDPFTVAIWQHEAAYRVGGDRVLLVVLHNDKMVAEMALKFAREIPLKVGALRLMEANSAASYHLNFFKRSLLLNYLRFKWKKEQSKNINNFCAAYSYPRKVVLISFIGGDHFNIFPMDFHGYIPGSNAYVLGLRTSNYTIDKIQEKRRIVVCEVPASKKDIIYTLGKHHGKNPPSVDALPFLLHLSKEFHFPYPEFTLSYYEVLLTHAEKLGSHMLLLGEVINNVTTKSPDRQLYHVHTIHHLHSRR